VVKLFENKRVFSDDFDGEVKEVKGLFDDGDWEGEEDGERFEILFAFEGVVEATVVDEG